MPLYEYTCAQGHTAEEWRAIASRDDETFCRPCLDAAPPMTQGIPGTRRGEEARTSAERARMTRRLARVQRPILRPLGYSLHPGDKGYWNLPGATAHSPDGLPAGGDAKHRAVQAAARSAGNPAPFAQAEDYEAHPPKIAGDDEPVYV